MSDLDIHADTTPPMCALTCRHTDAIQRGPARVGLAQSGQTRLGRRGLHRPGRSGLVFTVPTRVAALCFLSARSVTGIRSGSEGTGTNADDARIYARPYAQRTESKMLESARGESAGCFCA